MEASSGDGRKEREEGGRGTPGERAGRLDHDCTARRGIMDTIIRGRLEVLVIFLLPRLTRTLVHIESDDLYTGKRARENRTQIAGWEDFEGRRGAFLNFALKRDREKLHRDEFKKYESARGSS